MSRMSVRSLLLAGGALLAVSAAAAQDATSPGVSEEVVVTGSRGKPRSVLTTPVPVDVVSQGDIQKAGALGGEFGQTLQNLVPSFDMPRQSNSGSADLVRPAQLRGMSPDQVLVLVNGKRRHTTSITGTDAKTGRGTAPVDFNSIPTNAIKRVEVLRDGAGAQYGSDAIAGVINVILDDTPQGVEVDGSVGFNSTHFDPDDDHRDDGQTYIAQAKMGLPFDNGGFVRFGAEFKKRLATNRGAVGDVPFFEDPANEPLVGARVNFAPGDGKSENTNLWFNTVDPVGEAMEVYGFGTLNHRYGQGTGFFRYPISFANIQSVYPLGYRPITTGLNDDYALTAGLRSKTSPWNWDLSASYGLNRFDGGVKNSLNPSLGPTSPTRFHSETTYNELFTLNADASHDFDIGLVSPATLAFGAEYRHEHFKSEAGDPLSYAAGPFDDIYAIGAQAGTGLEPFETRKLSRDVYGVYIDASANLAENLLLDIAGRYENSSDFGDTVSGKAALRWEFAPGFALRGSISNSYRAPSLVQIGFATSSTSFGEGGQLTRVATLTPDDPLAEALGAKDLDPEKSVNYSAGFTAAVDAFHFSIDAYSIHVDDRITLSERIDSDAAGVSAAAQALFAARAVTAANFFTNAVDTRTQGIDAVATYRVEDVFGGTVDASAAFSYSHTKIVGVHDDGPVSVIGVEERNTVEGAAPDSKLILSLDWSDKVWSVLGRVTRYGGETRIFDFGGGFTPTQRYPSNWQFDTEVGYQVTENLNVYIGASNLFDEYPDKSIYDISYFANLPYDVLPPIGMNGRYLYAGFRATF